MLARLGRQQRHRPWHEFGEQARPLAAAGNEEVDAFARRRVRRIGEGADLRPQRVADHDRARGDRGRRLLQRREGAGDGGGAAGEQAVGAAHDGVLLVQHGGAAGGRCGQQRRQRRIAAEADHDRRVQSLEGLAGLQHAAPDGEARAAHAERIAGAIGGGGEGDDLLGRKITRIGRAAVVGGQHDAPAARDQHFGQGLRREEVAARAAGGDDREPSGSAHANAPAGASRVSYAPGRLRVSASAIPMVSPIASMEEPP